MPISWGRDGPAAIQANRDAIIQRAREAAEHAAHLKEELSKLDDSIALSRDVQRRAKAEARSASSVRRSSSLGSLAHDAGNAAAAAAGLTVDHASAAEAMRADLRDNVSTHAASRQADVRYPSRLLMHAYVPIDDPPRWDPADDARGRAHPAAVPRAFASAASSWAPARALVYSPAHVSGDLVRSVDMSQWAAADADVERMIDTHLRDNVQRCPQVAAIKASYEHADSAAGHDEDELARATYAARAAGGFCLRSFACRNGALSDKALRLLSESRTLPGQLRHVDIGRCLGITDAGIRALCAGTALGASLRTLRLEGMRDLTDDAGAAIAMGCRVLDTIDVSGNAGISDVTFVSLSRGCPKLRDVRAAGCTRLSDVGCRAVLDGCSALARLDVGATAVTCRAFVDQTIGRAGGRRGAADLAGGTATMATRCVSDIRVAGCRQLETAALGWLAGALGATLTRVDVSSCASSVRDEGIIALADAAAGRLRVFSADRCFRLTDTAGAALVESCADSLQDVSLCWCPMITPAHTYRPLLAAASGLRRLRADGATAASGCGALVGSFDLFAAGDSADHAAAAAAAAASRSLTALSLCASHGVGDPLLGYLSFALPRIRSLKLSGGTHDGGVFVSDEGVAALAATCTCLEVLHLGRKCSIQGEASAYAASVQRQLSDVALAALGGGECASTLCELELSHHALISGIGLAGRTLPRLHTLVLRGCLSLDGVGVHAALGACRSLTHLDADGCTHVPLDALRAAAAARPYVKCSVSESGAGGALVSVAGAAGLAARDAYFLRLDSENAAVRRIWGVWKNHKRWEWLARLDATSHIAKAYRRYEFRRNCGEYQTFITAYRKKTQARWHLGMVLGRAVRRRRRRKLDHASRKLQGMVRSRACWIVVSDLRERRWAATTIQCLWRGVVERRSEHLRVKQLQREWAYELQEMGGPQLVREHGADRASAARLRIDGLRAELDTILSNNPRPERNAPRHEILQRMCLQDTLRLSHKRTLPIYGAGNQMYQFDRSDANARRIHMFGAPLWPEPDRQPPAPPLDDFDPGLAARNAAAAEELRATREQLAEVLSPSRTKDMHATKQFEKQVARERKAGLRDEADETLKPSDRVQMELTYDQEGRAVYARPHVDVEAALPPLRSNFELSPGSGVGPGYSHHNTANAYFPYVPGDDESSAGGTLATVDTVQKRVALALRGDDARDRDEDTAISNLGGSALALAEELSVASYAKFGKALEEVYTAERAYEDDTPELGEMSLWPSMDRAQKASKQMALIIDSIKSDAELKRIDDAKKLEAELEAADEQARKQAERANAVSAGEHNGAAQFQRVRRGYAARRLRERLVSERDKESASQQAAHDEYIVVMSQARARGACSRAALRLAGVDPNDLFGSRAGKTAEAQQAMKNQVAGRVSVEFERRRRYERLEHLEELQRLEEKATKHFDEDLTFVNDKFAGLDVLVVTKREHHATVAAECKTINAEMAIVAGDLRIDERERDALARLDLEDKPEELKALKEAQLKVSAAELKRNRLQMKLRGCMVRRDHAKYLMDMAEGQEAFVMRHLRQVWRRQKSTRLLTSESTEALEWVVAEAETVAALRQFVQSRQDIVTDALEHRYYKEWLETQVSSIVTQLIRLDREQEFVLKKELDRLGVELAGVGSAHAMLDQLLGTFIMDAQYDAEKVGLDISMLGLERDSNEFVAKLEAFTALKAKQQLIREGSQQQLRVEIERLYKEEDTRLDSIVHFIGDQNGLARHRYETLEAKSKNRLEVRRHFVPEKWMDQFRSQPWLAKQAAEEAQNTEARDRKRLEVSKMTSILEKQQHEINLALESIEAINEEIAMHQEIIEAPETTARTRYESRALVKHKEEEKREYEEDTERRKGSCENRASDLRLLMAELAEEEADAKARLAKQNEARLEFEERESAEERKQLETCRARIAELKEEIAAIDEELDSPGGRKLDAELITIADDVETLIDSMASPEALQLPVAARQLLAEQVQDKKAELSTKKYKREKFLEDVKAQQELAKEEKKDLLAIERNLREREVRRRKLRKVAEETMRAEIEAKRLKDFQNDLRERRAGLSEEEMVRSMAADAEAERLKEIQADVARRKAQQDAQANAVGDLEGTGALFGQKKQGLKLSTRMKQILRGEIIEDLERVKMINSIKKRQKIKTGQVQAIRTIKFTVGTEETTAFERVQSRLQGEGQPHLKRVEKGIGQSTQIVIWCEKTIDQDEFLTDIVLSHTDVDHEYYRDMTKKNYQSIGHEQMLGASPSEPSFQMWIARDATSSRAIGDIKVSYSSSEEVELEHEGYIKIDESLANFNFGDIYLWVRPVQRNDIPQADSTAKLLREIKEVRQLRKQNMHDLNLEKMEQRLMHKLTKAQEIEDARREYDDHPVKYALEFLALSDRELKRFVEYFEVLDTEREGAITLDTFWEHLEEPRTMYTDHIFDLLGVLTKDLTLEFGEFMKAVGTWCFFGKEEMLRYTFSMFDKEGDGHITNDQFIELLSHLHPQNARMRVRRMLREFDLPKNVPFTYVRFEEVNILFPNLLYPAFRIQNLLRERYFGVPFWERKLRKYESIKKWLLEDKVSSSVLDARREARQKLRNEFIAKMQAKKSEARLTQSKVRRAILQAQLFADNFKLLLK